MFQHLIVPIDGSATSWAVVPIAARMAAAVDGSLTVVTVVDRIGDVGPASNELDAELDQLGPLVVDVDTEVLANDSVAEALARRLDGVPGSTVVMSSHGHGRSAAVVGSTVDDLLRLTYGPVVVVGPHVSPTAGVLDGAYVVPLDGAHASEGILSIVESWSIEFGAVPWLVEVLSPGFHASADVLESAYTARLARAMHKDTGREVEYEVLHGDKPARAIIDFADRMSASFVFAATHGRTGLARLRMGSVAADIVRHAACPVVLFRPPHID